MMNHGITLSAATASDDDGEVVIASVDLDARLGKYNDERFLEHRTKNARCNSEDDPSHVIGELLSLGRALESLGRRLQREAWGRIKHKEDMEAQRRVRGIQEWAERQVEKNEMLAEHNLSNDIQRAIIGVHHVGEMKRWGINSYMNAYAEGDDQSARWRWFLQQDPVEVSQRISEAGHIHGVGAHRISEVQKGVKRVLREYGRYYTKGAQA